MLGDLIEEALSSVGITQERVSKWLGRRCNCDEYREKINRLAAWAVRTVKMKKTDHAEDYLNRIIEEQL